jgi:hypothetical protein
VTPGTSLSLVQSFTIYYVSIQFGISQDFVVKVMSVSHRLLIPTVMSHDADYGQKILLENKQRTNEKIFCVLQSKIEFSCHIQ